MNLSSLDKTEYRLVFIIAHKFIRGYQSYTKHYIETINRLYEGALIIVVDNNSLNKDDVFDTLKEFTNVILLDNDIACKFEIGAYQIGLKYLIDYGLMSNFDYCICTQDNFILKNKYDFNELKEKDITACPINGYYPDGSTMEVVVEVLTKLGLYDNMDKIDFCWCNSFVINTRHIEQLYGYFKQIVITVRAQSCASERYLARILWELNGRKSCGDIDGNIQQLKDKHYYCWTVNLLENQTSFFC